MASKMPNGFIGVVLEVDLKSSRGILKRIYLSGREIGKLARCRADFRVIRYANVGEANPAWTLWDVWGEKATIEV